MSVDASNEQQQSAGETRTDTTRASRPSLLARLRTGLAETRWGVISITAVLMAVGWCVLFLSGPWLQILAGIVPVTGGLFVGRRVKEHLLLHGLLLGLIGFVIGGLIIVAYGLLGDAGVVGMPLIADPETGTPAPATFDQLIALYLSVGTMAMIPFPAFGTVMAGRSEQRNRELREQMERRGGRLEKPNTVRTLEDLRGLSLPQFGTYVRSLFQRNGFGFEDYRFIDKDKHLDLELSYQDEHYLLRLSVADKVRPGTVETLAQDMRRQHIPKGMVITSTEFTPDAEKSGKGRKNMLLVDGETLFEMAER
jgi:hypothetical protein